MIFVFAALSKEETNAIAADFAASLSPDSAATATFLCNVFKRVLIRTLRAVWEAVLRMFLIADFVFAIVKNCGTHHHETDAAYVKG